MYTDRKIGIIGGDERQLVCAKELACLGFECAMYGFDLCREPYDFATRCRTVDDAVNASAVVLLPLPVSADGVTLNMPLSTDCITLKELFSKFEKDQLIALGKADDKLKSLAKKRECVICDYYDREELQIANAVPTAEGALALAIEEMPITLLNAKALVIGYGRIGKVLCHLLNALHADVTAAARKFSDFAWINSNGYHPVHIRELPTAVTQADVIFNTVPHLVLGREILQGIHRDTLVIDLASKPGGVDFDAAKELGVNVIWALSLPGKTAPVSAGKIICDSVVNLMKEKGVIEE